MIETVERMTQDTAGFVVRERYLNALEAFMDKPVVKVLKGMRRVGKSVIMKLLIKRLLDRGVPGCSILYINKESLEFDDLRDYRDLYRHATDYFRKSDAVNTARESATGSALVPARNYILIDEVQEIVDWEKAVASFLADGLGDVVISGSNAALLSSELATLLSGRYVEIPVYPLTFREYLAFRGDKSAHQPGFDKATGEMTDKEAELKGYLRYGGLPGLHQLPTNDEVIFSYLNSILNTVLYRDVIARHKIRDVSILDRLVRYLFDNVGNITTAKKVADYFKSQRTKASVDTILNYIHYIETGLLVERVPRYDIKGKRLLEFYDKIFLNDIGLRHGLIGYRESDINGILENVVYKELQSRGYKICIGVLDQGEVDFIAEKQNEKKYIQVCYSLAAEATVDREFGNLEKIQDNYEKIVLSMDKFLPPERNGIVHQYLLDFLLEEK